MRNYSNMLMQVEKLTPIFVWSCSTPTIGLKKRTVQKNRLIKLLDVIA